MADRQQPTELIWDLTVESQVFADLRAFNGIDGDQWVIEVFEVAEGETIADWQFVDAGMLRLRQVREET